MTNYSSSNYMPPEETFESPPQSPGTPESISPPCSMAFRYEEDPKNLHKAAKADKATSRRALVSAAAQSKTPAKIRPKMKGKIPLDTAPDTKQAWIGNGTAALVSSIKWICIHTKDCRNSFTITNLCPNDPADIKCCLTKQFQDSAGNGGVCLNNPKTAATSCDGTFVKNRCPGPKDVQCCVFDAPPRTPTSRNVAVYFWINAFIPLHFEDVKKPWPKHPGKTMIEGLTTFLPVFGGCSLGDQRGFSSDDKATARMHSRAWVQIGPDMGSKGYKMQQQHFCSPTTKVDCDDGSVEDEGTAGNEGMKFTELAGGSANRVSLKLKAGAGNPLVAGEPKIDYEDVFTISTG